MEEHNVFIKPELFSGKERRRYKRIFFQSGMPGTFLSPENTENINATVLNLSEDGIGLTMRRGENKEIRVGDHLILMDIDGPTYLRFIANQNIIGEVRWVEDHDLLEHIALGCQFCAISKSLREQIRQLISSWQK